MSPLPVSYMPLDAGAATKLEGVSASTVTATAVGTGQHMLKIEGYSVLKRMQMHRESKSFIESPTFKVGGHTWRIRCYLNGNSMESTGFISLYLYVCCDDNGSAVHAEYEFALVPHQGTATAYGGGTPTSKTSPGVRTFGSNGNWNWGFPEFISVEELERSMFLKDDCLAVRCTVTVVRVRTVKEKAVTPQDLVRLGMLCKCDDDDDDLCKRNNARPAVTFLERFAKSLGHYICRGPGR